MIFGILKVKPDLVARAERSLALVTGETADVVSLRTGLEALRGRERTNRLDAFLVH